MGIIVGVNNNPGHVQGWLTGSSNSPGTILEVFPKLIEQKCPPDVPPPVTSAFLSGVDNLGRKGGTNAAAIMFRRSIEIATKLLNPEAPRSDLKKRIEGLAPAIATPAMKQWAHHVRLDANDAAHEPEEFTEADAKLLHTFAEMFLTYAFTLPAMMKRAKGEPT
jgi:hypothetical protein